MPHPVRRIWQYQDIPKGRIEQEKACIGSGGGGGGGDRGGMISHGATAAAIPLTAQGVKVDTDTKGARDLSEVMTFE